MRKDVFNNASNLNIINYFASRKHKTNYESLFNYIGYMKNAFLVHKAARYNIRGKEIISVTNKYYINDLSFKNYLYPGFAYGTVYVTVFLFQKETIK